jgi:peptide/nickel transport system permease protein
MARLALVRLAQVVPMLWAVLTALFLLLHAAPGGPVVALSGEFATADTVASIEAQLGLDRPLIEQYWRFLALAAEGDLGTSYFYKRPVTEVVLAHLPATLLLVVPAIVFAALIGIPLGIFSARHGAGGPLLVAMSLIAFAIPVFWLGHLMRLGVSVELGWLPVQGMSNPRIAPGWAHALDVARHAVLPWATLTLHQLAFTVLITRAALTAEVGRPYFLTALMKGCSRWRAETRHALPNGAAPLLVLFGNRIGWLIAGAVLVETVVAWPGLGQLVAAAIQNRDYPLVIGVVLVAALFTMVANLVADLAILALDPRVREEVRL